MGELEEERKEFLMNEIRKKSVVGSGRGRGSGNEGESGRSQSNWRYVLVQMGHHGSGVGVEV
jgi:hypothetical protein